MVKKKLKKEQRSWPLTFTSLVLSVAVGYLAYIGFANSADNPFVFFAASIAGVLALSLAYLAVIGKKSTLYAIGGWFADITNLQ